MKYVSWSNEAFSISAAPSIVTEAALCKNSKRVFLCCFFDRERKIIICGCLNFDEKKHDKEELMKGDGREDGR